MTYDPILPLEKLSIRILALWGEKDSYLPFPDTVSAFKAAMERAGNGKQVYPSGNHSFLESESGSPSTGGTEVRFSADVWKLQSEWLRGTVE